MSSVNQQALGHYQDAGETFAYFDKNGKLVFQSSVIAALIDVRNKTMVIHGSLEMVQRCYAAVLRDAERPGDARHVVDDLVLVTSGVLSASEMNLLRARPDLVPELCARLQASSQQGLAQFMERFCPAAG